MKLAAILVSLSAVALPPTSTEKSMVMGEDFRALLANPNLTLQTEEGPGVVYFIWKSESSARLAEALKLGQHMIKVKKQLEIEGEVSPQSIDATRTAGRD